MSFRIGWRLQKNIRVIVNSFFISFISLSPSKLTFYLILLKEKQKIGKISTNLSSGPVRISFANNVH